MFLFWSGQWKCPLFRTYFMNKILYFDKTSSHKENISRILRSSFSWVVSSYLIWIDKSQILMAPILETLSVTSLISFANRDAKWHRVLGFMLCSFMHRIDFYFNFFQSCAILPVCVLILKWWLHVFHASNSFYMLHMIQEFV